METISINIPIDDDNYCGESCFILFFLLISESFGVLIYCKQDYEKCKLRESKVSTMF